MYTNDDPRTSRVSIFKELGWLSLQYRRDFHKCIMIYKCWNGLALQYLCDMFNANDSMHYYNIQTSSQLQALKSCTAYYHVVSQYLVWTFGIVFLEISKKVFLCQVLKVHYSSLLMLNPIFNLMWFYWF